METVLIVTLWFILLVLVAAVIVREIAFRIREHQDKRRDRLED